MQRYLSARAKGGCAQVRLEWEDKIEGPCKGSEELPA